MVYETTINYHAAGQRFVQSTLVPDSDAEGKVRGYFALIQDLSDRKAAERALQIKAAREHAIRLITKRIRQTLELQEILATAVEENSALSGGRPYPNFAVYLRPHGRGCSGGDPP